MNNGALFILWWIHIIIIIKHQVVLVSDSCAIGSWLWLDWLWFCHLTNLLRRFSFFFFSVLLDCFTSCMQIFLLCARGIEFKGIGHSSWVIERYTLYSLLVSYPVDPNYTNSHRPSEAKKYSQHGYFCCFGNMAVIFIDFI